MHYKIWNASIITDASIVSMYGRAEWLTCREQAKNARDPAS